MHKVLAVVLVVPDARPRTRAGRAGAPPPCPAGPRSDTHGQQFKAGFLRTSLPNSADGIERYLSSGMIRGVGPVYAKKLVRAFGEKVFDVIEATPDRLREVDGIGPVRAASILAAWAEQKAVRDVRKATQPPKGFGRSRI